VTGREKAQRKIKDSEMNQGTKGILDEQGESWMSKENLGAFLEPTPSFSLSVNDNLLNTKYNNCFNKCEAS
jgi:hypothetical protein